MTEPYGHIFLQWGHRSDWDSLTWCQDRIDDDDVEYVRKDLCNSTLKDAAPDLLQACERAKLAFETILDMGFMPSSDYDSDTKILINMMDKTIKKAKGEK